MDSKDFEDFFGKPQTYFRLVCNSIAVIGCVGCGTFFFSLKGLDGSKSSSGDFTHLAGGIMILVAFFFGSFIVFDLSIAVPTRFFKDIREISDLETLRHGYMTQKDIDYYERVKRTVAQRMKESSY